MLSPTAIDRRVFAPVSARHHQLLVVALASTIGVRLATHDYTALADLPPAMFSPPWFLGPLDGPPPTGVLAAVQVAGVLGAGAAVVRRGRRVLPLAVAWLALLLLGGVETSAGKILHNDVLVLLATAPFLVPPLRGGTASAPTVAGWHHRVAMVLVAVGYAAAGAVKLRHSGIAWVTSDNLRWVLYTGARRASTPLPELARALADRAWLATSIAAATLVSELLFPIGLVARRLRVWCAAAVVTLHVGVFLTLGLDYWTWVATVLILFTPWTAAAGSGTRRHSQRRQGRIHLGV